MKLITRKKEQKSLGGLETSMINVKQSFVPSKCKKSSIRDGT